MKLHVPGNVFQFIKLLSKQWKQKACAITTFPNPAGHKAYQADVCVLFRVSQAQSTLTPTVYLIYGTSATQIVQLKSTYLPQHLVWGKFGRGCPPVDAGYSSRNGRVPALMGVCLESNLSHLSRHDKSTAAVSLPNVVETSPLLK